MTFDRDKAKEKLGGMYRIKDPDPNCKICKGEGVYKSGIQVGLEMHPYNTYCDCVVDGFA